MDEKIKIQIFGSGCPSCKKLFELTKKAVRELGLQAEVEYITDIQKIIELGVMQSPVLAINGKPVMTGSVSDTKEIKAIINKNLASEQPATMEKSGCCCNGNCQK